MRHLIICPEYPPASTAPGGIGTYVLHIAGLLADAGETVHVIGELWEGAPKRIEEFCGGRLIVHRVPGNRSRCMPGKRLYPELSSKESRGLGESAFKPQCFSWHAGLLAESLVAREGIDVIEAQEFAAPLYYFQLRRALGLGPKRRPPCIVHIHSPTELIVQHNEYDFGHDFFTVAQRLEDFSIGSADALLCPSRYLARHAETRYGFHPGALEVIRLPIGDTRLLERTESAWEQGTICYVGRLEPRKGVIEWVSAAVRVAREDPSARFEFIGADLPYTGSISMHRFLQRKIPHTLRDRFVFRGSRPRAELSRFLAGARVAVVPSRWENFPNTCVEAMCSGLPVIATRFGGMAELIEDGRTGWLTPPGGREHMVEGLADGLRRALSTSAQEKAAMGGEAAMAVRRLCDNAAITQQHLAYRERVVQQGAKRSLYLPACLTGTARPGGDAAHNTGPAPGSEGGLAVVVTCLDARSDPAGCLQSIQSQTRSPAIVTIVAGDAVAGRVQELARQFRRPDWKLVRAPGSQPAAAKNAGIEAARQAGHSILGWMFLDPHDLLQPDCVAAGEGVLHNRPEVGLVSSWVHFDGDRDRVAVHPCPSFPYQWLANEVASSAVIRAAALDDAGAFRLSIDGGYENWDLANAVMAAGWAAVTYPGVLSRRTAGIQLSHSASNPGHFEQRRALLARFPDLVARDAQALVLSLERRAAGLQQGYAGSWHALFYRIRRRQRALTKKIYSRLRLGATRVLPGPSRADSHPVVQTLGSNPRGISRQK